MPFHVARKVIGSTECSLAETTLERSVAGMTTVMAKLKVKIKQLKIKNHNIKVESSKSYSNQDDSKLKDYRVNSSDLANCHPQPSHLQTY